MKRFLKIFIAVIFAFIIAIILLPIFFKPELIKALKEQINESINAEVDFKDVDISFIRSLPKLTIEVDDLNVTGVNQFEGKKLLSTNSLSLTTDFKSLFKSQEGITIYSIEVDNADINLLINETGQPNYDISKPKESSKSSDSFFGSIERYQITNSKLTYTDQVSKMKMELDEVNHNGKGQFKDVQFDLSTSTEIKKTNFTYDGISYLKNATVTGDIDLGIDNDAQKYTFKENNIKVNDLDLSFIGYIQLLEDAFDLDLKIDAPNNKVSSIISIIPNLYTEDFGNITSKGTGTLRGSVKGIYNGQKEVLPAIDFKIALTDGYIKYPNLKLPINNINIDATVLAKNSKWNDLAVSIKNADLTIDKNKVAGELFIKNALNNFTLNGQFLGKVDLRELTNAFPITIVDIKSGKIDIDAQINATKNDILNKNFKAITFSGNSIAEDLDLVYNGLDIKSSKIDVSFSPKQIIMLTQKLNVGQSDFGGKIEILEPLTLLSDSILPQTNILVSSNVLNATELQKAFTTEEASDSLITTDIILPVSSIQYSAKQINYENYVVKNLQGNMVTTSKTVDIKDAAFNLDGANINMRGDFDNVDGYLNNKGKLKGKLFVESDNLDANKYITEEDSNSTESQIIRVPNVYDIEVYPTIDNLTYGNYKFQNMTGKIVVNEGILELENGQTKLFNGKIKFDGKYDSSKEGNPVFDFKYNMDDLEFQKMFNNSKSFKALAPIAGFIEGVFNSTLIISGPLDNNMLPDLTKINASGFLETVQGKLKGFKPLETLSNALGINELSNWDIKDSRNWFDIQDGVVNIKPHEYNFNQMTFTVGGSHALDQTINYVIKAKIPREKLKSANLGSVLESGMSTLEQAATSRGVNIDLGENVFLDIYLTGSITKPKIKVIPVGSGGKTLQEVVKNKIDAEVKVLKDTINKEIEKKKQEVKDSINKVVKTQVDTLKQKVDKEVKEQTDKLKDQIISKVDSSKVGAIKDSLESKVGQKVEDALGDKAKNEIDSLKEKLNDWNPWKKKKKN